MRHETIDVLGCNHAEEDTRICLIASLSDSHGASLRCSTPTVRLELRSVFPRLVQTLVICVVTARSSAYTKLRVPGRIGWSFVYMLKRSGARTLPCGRPFLCDRHLLLFPPSSTKKRRFSSRVRIMHIRR